MNAKTEVPLNTHQAQYVSEQLTSFQPEKAKGTNSLLESLFRSINTLGNEYAFLAAAQLNGDSDYQNMIAERVIAKEYQHLQKPKTMDAYNEAVRIGRETETVKRVLFARVLLEHPESFSPVEHELLGGAVILSQYADTIFFDEWLPTIRDSEIGKALHALEEQAAGSSLGVLPGTPDSMRWFTRKLIDSDKPIEKDNIQLVPYKDALPTVNNMIVSLREMADNLELLKHEGQDDFGYVEYFRAWAECLAGVDPNTQKEKEDNMFITWRRVNPQAPLYFVAMAENEYEDPAGIAMVPSVRAGVLDESDQAQSLKLQESDLKNVIIQYTTEQNVFGAENLKRTDTHYRIWSLFGGSDMLFGISSEFLPNDPGIQSKEGAGIFPDLAQQEKGHYTRDVFAEKVYPEPILTILRDLRFSLQEGSIHEIQSHELNHLPAVTLEAINAIGKTRNLLEEAKATLGGLIAQIRIRHNQDIEFQKRAAATLLHAAPRYMAIDGNPTYQGYVNDTRIVLIAAEKANILTFNEANGWSLDLDNTDKIVWFWNLIEEFVAWTYHLYADVTDAPVEQRPGIAQRNAGELDTWVGKKPEPGNDLVNDRTIRAIKSALQ